MIPVVVHRPIHEYYDRRYMDFMVNEETRKKIEKIHKSVEIDHSKPFDDCLSGNILRVKVPFRYNRVMCKTEGHKTIYEYQVKDKAIVNIKFCGFWNTENLCGVTWKLISINEP